MSRPGSPPSHPGAGGTPGEGSPPGHPGTKPSKGGGESTEAPVGATAFLCDLCGAPMMGRHCKLVCPDCGYMRDCSDP